MESSHCRFVGLKTEALLIFHTILLSYLDSGDSEVLRDLAILIYIAFSFHYGRFRGRSRKLETMGGRVELLIPDVTAAIKS